MNIEDPVPGILFHTYAPADDGEIGYQGQVLSAAGDKVRVQLFSWRTGRPADIETFSRAFLSEGCRLYADQETWRAVGEREMAATAHWRRWHRTRKPIAGIPA